MDSVIGPRQIPNRELIDTSRSTRLAFGRAGDDAFAFTECVHGEEPTPRASY